MAEHTILRLNSLACLIQVRCAISAADRQRACTVLEHVIQYGVKETSLERR